MAIGLQSDFKIYQAEFQTGEYESIVQNVNVFNGASNDAISLEARSVKGEYEKKAFFDLNSSLVSRRDLTSTSALTDQALTQGEIVDVKLARKWHTAQSLNSWRKIAETPEELSYLVGLMAGEAKAKAMVNAALIAAQAGIDNQSTAKYDATGETTKTMTHAHLASGLAKFGDQASRIVCWVMHSKVYFDLIKQSISDKITNVADVTIYQGTAATLGRPTIVTDDSALWNLNGSATDTYNTLGLVRMGVRVNESEIQDVAAEVVTGGEQLYGRIQGEFSINVGLAGFTWDVTNGGANPNDATLGTGSNWDLEVSSVKNAAGIEVLTQ